MTKLFPLIALLYFASAGSKSLDEVLLHKYAKLQSRTKCSFIVTSGYRSKEKNRAVGGSLSSFHMQSKALDIVPKETCNKSLYELGKIATKLFNGVIVYPTHIHLDVGDRIYHNLGENK